MNNVPPVLQVIPSRASSARDLPALETAMQALALDERSPIALEIAATPTTRQFLLRAESTLAVRSLEQQIQARYPQATIAPAASDPLVCGEGEACSVVELRPGAAAFLPLRTWKPRDLLTEGTDPLLGVLAAFGILPSGWRAVAHLALVPAVPAWSARLRRYALEHPLEKERQQAAMQQRMHSHSLREILILLPIVALLVGFYEWGDRLPLWLRQAFGQVLAGQMPTLSTEHQQQLLIGGVLLLVLLFGGIVLLAWLVARFARPLYDPRLAAEKTARPAYRVRLRLYVFSPSPHSRPRLTLRQHLQRWDTALRAPLAMVYQQRASHAPHWPDPRRQRRDMLRALAAPYRQYALASGGFFVPRREPARRVRTLLTRPARRWVRRVGWSADVRRSQHLLSVADLAALWHLPQEQDLDDLPFVEASRMKTLPVPTILTTSAGYPLGISTHAGHTRPVVLPTSCLRQNMLVAASTGKGKSTLFEHLIQALARARVQGALTGGALLVDPHGDLADHVAGALPAELADEVVFVRLADRDFPVGFNPLDMAMGQDRDKMVDNFIGIVESLWPTSYGPRTESFLEYGCKTLAEANLTLIGRDPFQGPDQQFTLLDLVPLFRNEVFRHAILEQVADQHVKNWWDHYFERLDGRQQAEFTSSLVTKMAKFASSRISRRVLGQPRSSLDIANLIAQEKIVLLSCAAGEVGADLAALFGSLLVGFFQTALAEQARLPEDQRHHVLVLIDEFQVLGGINYQTMLAELRKYGGAFALATQSLAYLDRFERTLRATVLANVKHVFAFAMADEDARLLRLPGVEPEDLVQLPNYACYARLGLAGTRLPVFSLRMHPAVEAQATLRTEIIGRCRTRYGHPVGLVDQVLQECEARQRTLKPQQTKRKGKQGKDVTWTGTGEERVEEVLATTTRRQRIRGHGNTGTPSTVQHALYGDEETSDDGTA